MNKFRCYRIQVAGEVDPNWSDRLEGMRISTDRSGETPTRTILVGSLRDQAALSGVLNTLYELHLTVLSVNCLDENHG
jgi:hypothetical protein